MSKLIWNEENLSKLGRKFLAEVKRNMREEASNRQTTVRFGVTGEGIKPNYQTTFPNGVVRVISGISHDTFERADFNEDEFNVLNLSQPFTCAQIEEAYGNSVVGSEKKTM